MLRLVTLAVLAALVTGTAALSFAQQRGRGGYYGACAFDVNACERAPYDGRFTFLRVYFDARGGGGFGGGGEPAWHHDKPNAERNLSSILREISTMRTFDGETGGNATRLTDPELFRHPIIWMAEPGYWQPTDEEVAALRAYLLKGGFIIFDDFSGSHWYNFQAQMLRVLPELQPIEMDGSEPIFDAFFEITPNDLRLSDFSRQVPTYLGLFEDNDRTKRQLAMINYNNDVGEYMDYEPQGFLPVGSNEAYKLGVNYIIYALTH